MHLLSSTFLALPLVCCRHVEAPLAAITDWPKGYASGYVDIETGLTKKLLFNGELYPPLDETEMKSGLGK